MDINPIVERRISELKAEVAKYKESDTDKHDCFMTDLYLDEFEDAFLPLEEKAQRYVNAKQMHNN